MKCIDSGLVSDRLRGRLIKGRKKGTWGSRGHIAGGSSIEDTEKNA